MRSLKPIFALLLLLVAFAALVAFISPFHNTPVQDDWDYARTVQILLQSGAFERSEIAQATEISSALWGAGFAAVLGFSFDTLRISTLVLSAVSLVLFFALLGELGFGVVQRTLGVAALLVSPLFLFLSFSFMTDIPALACLLAALYCYVRALQRGSLRWALAGSLCTALGFLTRQLGLVSALAAAAYFFARTPRPSALSSAVRPTNKDGRRLSEGSPIPATRLDSIVRRRRAARAGVRPDDYTPSISSRLTGIVRRRRATLHPSADAQPTLQRRTFTPPLRPRDYAPSLGQRLGWAMASAALPVSVALLYSLWLSLAGGVTWANSQVTLGGTLDFVRDPQTPATLLRRIVEDCMTLAVYALPLWLFLMPALRGRRETSATPLPPLLINTRSAGRFRRLRASITRSVAKLVRMVPWWWLAALVVAAIFALTVFRLAQRGETLPYLTDVVTRQGLRPYLAYFAYAGGSFRPDILPLPFWAALTLLGGAGGWALAMLALGRFRLRASGADSGAGFVYWSALCLAVPTLLFPEFYERFLLPFLPVTVLLLLDAQRRAAASHAYNDGTGNALAAGQREPLREPGSGASTPAHGPAQGGVRAASQHATSSRTHGGVESAELSASQHATASRAPGGNIAPARRDVQGSEPRAGRRSLAVPLLAAAGVLLMAGCSLALLRDYWDWMDVRWPLAESIVAGGVPLQSLDGGYEWDGWHLYDQSMAFIRQRQLRMQITPWAYVINPQVMLAFAPLAGYHVTRVVQFDSPFGADAGRFYVLEKD